MKGYRKILIITFMQFNINQHIMDAAKALGLLCLAILIFLGSCKKPEYPIENSQSYSKVFMQLASNGVVNKSLPIKDEWVSMPFGAGYGGLDLATQNIEVGFQIDQAMITAYNEQNNTNYELPPQDSYRMTSPSVTIAAGHAGSNSTALEINALKLAGTKSYLIPVHINSVQPNIPVADGLETTYFIVNGFYETNPFVPIPLTGWTVHDFSDDDYDAIGGRAPYCIDGDVSTCWLSTYRRVNNWRPPHPHYVTIDMHMEHLLHGITLFGRRGASNAYLFPKNVRVEVSDDGTSWRDAGLYSIAASSEDTSATMYFEKSLVCRYFKVTVLSSAGNGDTTAIAELVAF